jgi:hypothetical protein
MHLDFDLYKYFTPTAFEEPHVASTMSKSSLVKIFNQTSFFAANLAERTSTYEQPRLSPQFRHL